MEAGYEGSKTFFFPKVHAQVHFFLWGETYDTITFHLKLTRVFDNWHIIYNMGIFYTVLLWWNHFWFDVATVAQLTSLKLVNTMEPIQKEESRKCFDNDMWIQNCLGMCHTLTCLVDRYTLQNMAQCSMYFTIGIPKNHHIYHPSRYYRYDHLGMLKCQLVVSVEFSMFFSTYMNGSTVSFSWCVPFS